MEIWVARDDNGDLYMYNEKPVKNLYGIGFWDILEGEYQHIDNKHLFKDVLWDDEDPLKLVSTNINLESGVENTQKETI